MIKYSYILNEYYDTRDAAAVFRSQQVAFYVKKGVKLIDLFFDEQTSTLFHVFWKDDSSEVYKEWKKIERGRSSTCQK